MTQKRITKPKSWEKDQKEAEAIKKSEQDRTLVDESNDLMDEIDGLLEEQEILSSYRQRGGQ